ARDRRGQPEHGQILQPGAQGGEDSAGVGVLQREAELDAEEAEAHVPQLPERQARLERIGLHFHLVSPNAARTRARLAPCSKVTWGLLSVNRDNTRQRRAKTPIGRVRCSQITEITI